MNEYPTILSNHNLNVVEIEKIVLEAFQHAKSLLLKLDVNILLEKYHLTTLEALSIEMFNNLKHSSRLVDSVTSNSFLDSNSEYDDESDNEQASNYSEEIEDGNSSTDSDYDRSNSMLRSNRDGYCGMRIFDSVDHDQSSSYFEIVISGNKKFIHKQTACWLLTEETSRLSSDRLSRVKQTK